MQIDLISLVMHSKALTVIWLDISHAFSLMWQNKFKHV